MLAQSLFQRLILPLRRASAPLLLALACTALPQGAAQAQVDVGNASYLRRLIPAETLETSSADEYQKLLQQAKAQGRWLVATTPSCNACARLPSA